MAVDAFVCCFYTATSGTFACLDPQADLVYYGLVHQFFVRASNHKPEQSQQAQAQQYRVFGMTARILVDAARVAYAEEPQFEHNSHFGDEAMIANLRKLGRLGAVRRATDELTLETMEKAAKLS